ncbi:MAG: hypothetical protein A2X49_03125 [Lentisphaerae bacterium GWF2_52_8]|nr:MAG: hypothetical protein A2X49_03125 [Lentisphaerae bacterium GWF2_52_8]
MDIDRINRKVFAGLGKEKQLVEYHDIMHKLLGIVIDFINADGESLKLSKMRHFNPYCMLLRSTKSGFAACQNCDQYNAGLAASKHEALIYKCHGQLTEIVVPLYDQGKRYIGCMTSGQFHLEGGRLASNKAIDDLATAHKVKRGLLRKYYRETKKLSSVQVEGIIEYLNAIGRFIEERHNKILFLETIDAPDKISLIKQFIEENYMKKLNIKDTAKRFFLCPEHFCRFFKKEVGISFMSFVNIYRASKAEEILKQTKRNISEIALSSGFGSISQFNRTFKNIKGISARAFRATGGHPAAPRHTKNSIPATRTAARYSPRRYPL